MDFGSFIYPVEAIALLVFALSMARNSVVSRAKKEVSYVLSGISLLLGLFAAERAVVFFDTPDSIQLGLFATSAILEIFWAIASIFWIDKATARFKERALSAALKKATEVSSGFPRATLQWISYDEVIILSVTESMRDWLQDQGLAQRSDVVAGANWYNFMGDNKEWREIDRSMAFGNTYENKAEAWMTKTGEAKILQKSGSFITGDGIPEHCFYVELWDPQEYLEEIKQLKIEVEGFREQNANLQVSVNKQFSTYDSELVGEIRKVRENIRKTE